MLLKVFLVFSFMVMFFIVHDTCRRCSSYFSTNKCQKYIIIKNPLLSVILISERIKRDKMVYYRNLDKMSIVGFISYIILEPINLLFLVINIIDIFELRNVQFEGIYYTIPLCVWVTLNILFMVVIMVDKY